MQMLGNTILWKKAIIADERKRGHRNLKASRAFNRFLRGGEGSGTDSEKGKKIVRDLVLFQNDKENKRLKKKKNGWPGLIDG